MRTVLLILAFLLPAAAPAAASHTNQEPLPDLKTVRHVGHTPDADGGPPWVVRTWRTVRAPSHGLYGGQTCMQIGRAAGAELVRTYTSGRRRPMNFRDRTICGSQSKAAVADAPLILERLVDDPASPAPRPARTVIAGLAPENVRSVEILGAGPAHAPRIDPQTRVWLVVLPGTVRQAQLTLHYRLARYARRIDLRNGDTLPTDADRMALVPGTIRRPLTVRDPAGGLPFGVVTYDLRVRGRPKLPLEQCVEPGRIVAGEIGPYEPSWGSFLDSPILIDLYGFMDVWLPHGFRINGTGRCADTSGPEPDPRLEDDRFEAIGIRRFARDVIVVSGGLRPDVRGVDVHTTTAQPVELAVGARTLLAAVKTTGALGERVVVTQRLANGRAETRRIPIADYEYSSRWMQYAPLPDGTGVRLAWIAGNADDPFVGVDAVRHADRLVVAVRELSGPSVSPEGSPGINFLQVDLRCVDLILDPADRQLPVGDAAAGGKLRTRVALRDLSVPRYGRAPTNCLRLRAGARLPVPSFLEKDLSGFVPSASSSR